MCRYIKLNVKSYEHLMNKYEHLMNNYKSIYKLRAYLLKCVFFALRLSAKLKFGTLPQEV